MPKPDIDFSKVDMIRVRMSLTIRDMCLLVGVSRPTYYKWLAGNGINEENQEKVKAALRRFLPLLKAGAWPPPEAANWSGAERRKALLELLGGDE